MLGGGLVKKAAKKVRAVSSLLSKPDQRASRSTSRRVDRRPPSPAHTTRRKGRRPRTPSPPPVDEEEDWGEHKEGEYEEGEDSESEKEEEELPVFDLEDEEGEARVRKEPPEYVEPEYTGMPQEPRTTTPYMRGGGVTT
jgi:hypothetical protein